ALMIRASFHRDTFGEIARLIYVAAELDREVISEELKGNDSEDGADEIWNFGHRHDVVSDAFELLRAIAGSDGNDGAFAGADLLDVIHVLREDGVVGRDEDRREIGADEGDDAVLELGAGMAFGKKIGDLF